MSDKCKKAGWPIQRKFYIVLVSLVLTMNHALMPGEHIRRITRGFRGVHQAWNEHKTQGCLIIPGKDYGKVVELATGHITCPDCHRIVELDERGFAFCDCRIWNDGKPFGETKKEIRRHTKHFLRKISRV